MYNLYNNIDDYNPQILFVIDGKCSFDEETPKTEYHCHDHMELFNEQTNCTELHIGISNLSSNKGSNCIDIGDTNVITLNKYKDELLKCCSEIVDEQKGSKPSYPFMLKALVMKLLVLLDNYLKNIMEFLQISLKKNKRIKL